MDNILIPNILAIIISVIYLILIVKVLLLRIVSRKSEILLVEKKNKFILLPLLFNILIFLIYYFLFFKDERLYLLAPIILVIAFSSIYYVLKFISPRQITENGILNINKHYSWKEIENWSWKGNKLCVDIRKKYKIIGYLYDYIEINVPLENVDHINRFLIKFAS